MLAPSEACSPRTIITFSLIVLAGAIQLRRWDSIKPTLVLLSVFFGSASSGVIGILMSLWQLTRGLLHACCYMLHAMVHNKLVYKNHPSVYAASRSPYSFSGFQEIFLDIKVKGAGLQSDIKSEDLSSDVTSYPLFTRYGLSINN